MLYSRKTHIISSSSTTIALRSKLLPVVPVGIRFLSATSQCGQYRGQYLRGYALALVHYCHLVEIHSPIGNNGPNALAAVSRMGVTRIKTLHWFLAGARWGPLSAMLMRFCITTANPVSIVVGRIAVSMTLPNASYETAVRYVHMEVGVGIMIIWLQRGYVVGFIVAHGVSMAFETTIAVFRMLMTGNTGYLTTRRDMVMRVSIMVSANR